MGDGGQPQYGVVKSHRPFPGFEAVYEGQSVSLPILFTEGGIALDAQAGEPGYDPNLVRGTPVPMGSRINIWLPAIFAVSDALAAVPYNWIFFWRLRSLFDYRQERLSWHLGKQGDGVPDTTAPVGQQARVVIPASHHSSIYNECEPAAAFADVTQTIRVENLSPRRFDYGLPLVPDGSSGAIQQGLLNPALTAAALRPEYQLIELTALGDELILGVTRTTDAGATWAFASNDAILSDQFGSGTGQVFQDIGLYVMAGKKS